MYSIALIFHSIFRWIILLSLIYLIIRSSKGYFYNIKYSFWDNKIRYWMATIAHIQLIIGILVYIKSPIVQHYFSNFKTAISNWELTFFSLFHSSLMISAIVLVTIGSAKAKRKLTDKEKFKTTLLFFSLAFVIIMIAIPWPFSPLANRPYIRTF